MALTVEDGTGLANADSYDSLVNIQLYLANFGLNTAWDLLTTSAQEIAARTATKYLDTMYGPRWAGIKSSQDQALDWGRRDVYDFSGRLIDPGEVPTKIKNATALLAVKSTTESLYSDVTNPGLIKEIEQKIPGPLEQRIEYLGGASQHKQFTEVEDLLSEFLCPIGQVDRG